FEIATEIASTLATCATKPRNINEHELNQSEGIFATMVRQVSTSSAPRLAGGARRAPGMLPIGFITLNSPARPRFSISSSLGVAADEGPSKAFMMTRYV